MSVLFTEKLELLQINPNGTSGFLRANPDGDIVLWDGIFTEGETALHKQSWTGDGTTTAFTISNPVQEVVMLDINGLIYPSSEYDVTGQTLTIEPAVPNGYLITLTYFESLTGQGQATGISDAINGLTNSNNVAELGGSLYKHTTINAAESSFYTVDTTYLSKTALFGVLTNINFGLANLSDFIGVYQENTDTFQAMGLDRNSDSLLIRSFSTTSNIDNRITMNADGSSDIKIINNDPTFGVGQVHVSQGSLLMDFNNVFTITDTKTAGSRTGLEYAEDYTSDAAATALTLATKGYVDTQITGITLTAGEGIDLTTNAISFKNSSNLTDNFLVKWDDTNVQLDVTVFQDDGTGWSIGTGAVSRDVGAVVIGESAADTTGTINSDSISIGTFANQGIDDIGLSSITIGDRAEAKSTRSISIGTQATTGGTEDIAIGYLASSINIYGVSIGQAASVIGQGGISIGRIATGSNNNNIVIGAEATAAGNQGIALGYQGDTTGGGISLGYNTASSNGISIGSSAVSGTSSVAIYGSANNSESVAIAGTADQLRALAIKGTVTGSFATALGHLTEAGTDSVALGAYAISTSSAVAIGNYAGAGTGTKGTSFVAIGLNAGNAADIGNSAILIGNASDAEVASSIAIGQSARVLIGSTNGIAIGTNVTNSGSYSVAIQSSVDTSATSVVIGYDQTITAASNTILIGTGGTSTGTSSVVLGNTTSSSANYGIAIGTRVSADAQGAIAMGSTVSGSVSNTTSNSVAFGWVDGAPTVLFAETSASYINGTGLVIGTDTLATSAILELSSTTKALLVSRIADPDSDVTTPVDGMIAFDSTDSQLQAYINSAWRNIGGAGINPTGTADRLSKFTSTGDDLEESRIIDNGNQYSFGTLTNLGRSGEIAYANSTIDILGDAQTSKMIANAQTSDNTTTEMFLDSGNSRIAIQQNSVAGFVITITALEIELAGTSGTTNPARVAQYKGGIKNIAASTTLVDTVTEILLATDTEADNWDVAVTANNLTNTLQIDVTGDVGKVINWVANIELIETKF